MSAITTVSGIAQTQAQGLQALHALAMPSNPTGKLSGLDQHLRALDQALHAGDLAAARVAFARIQQTLKGGVPPFHPVPQSASVAPPSNPAPTAIPTTKSVGSTLNLVV